MFKEDYKDSFKDIKASNSLKLKTKEKMILEYEKRNKANIFYKNKLAYGVSLALLLIIVGRVYKERIKLLGIK